MEQRFAGVEIRDKQVLTAPEEPKSVHPGNQFSLCRPVPVALVTLFRQFEQIDEDDPQLAPPRRAVGDSSTRRPSRLAGVAKPYRLPAASSKDRESMYASSGFLAGGVGGSGSWMPAACSFALADRSNCLTQVLDRFISAAIPRWEMPSH